MHIFFFQGVCKLGVDLLQLDNDVLYGDYVNNLTNIFIDQWDKSRSRTKFGRSKQKNNNLKKL